MSNPDEHNFDPASLFEKFKGYFDEIFKDISKPQDDTSLKELKNL